MLDRCRNILCLYFIHQSKTERIKGPSLVGDRFPWSVTLLSYGSVPLTTLGIWVLNCWYRSPSKQLNCLNVRFCNVNNHKSRFYRRGRSTIYLQYILLFFLCCLLCINTHWSYVYDWST